MSNQQQSVIENIKANLDKQLESADSNVGIAFGEDLFRIFRENQWIKLEDYGLLGTSLFSEKIPAYQQTHFAFTTWGLGKLDFKVGQKQK